MKKLKLILFLSLSILLFVAIILINRQATTASGGFAIVSMQPQPRTLTAATTTSITLQFDNPVNPATITKDTFWAFGRWSGPAAGNYSFSNNNQTVTLMPPRPFSAGEQVMVIISNQIESDDGTPLRSAGYSYQFWTEAAVSDLDFEVIDTLNTRNVPGPNTRAYGGTATDLNNDGWLDLTIVNEDTADLRVFMNKADGTGLFNDFLVPPSPVNQRASPNETSDFDRDGFADIAVVNIDTSSVSILLGNGDGTFAPQQEITVSGAPRGIAILDVDGDGDTDIVNTNSSGGSGSLSLLVNDGSGVFGSPTFFEGGITGEYALAAADMNEDAILDLVVGARTSATMIVNTGNGDGTFTAVLPAQSSGGATWMINVGDVNGDGHEDVASANSDTNNGSILLGDGLGNLQAPMIVPTDPFPLATDLGDIDGDGDLDWMTSSFLGDWNLFINNGGQQGGNPGTFTFLQDFQAPIAASCALFLDFDNDGDLDLALIDELADVVILVKNRSTPQPQLENFIPFLRNED